MLEYEDACKHFLLKYEKHLHPNIMHHNTKDSERKL